jgi:hypothetical protein
MRLSTGLTNQMLGTGSIKDVMNDCVCDIYSGVQPTLPDAVPNGTLLATVTKNSGAVTAETAAHGSMTLTGGGAGSVNTVTVNSINILGTAVDFITDLATTATAVALQINTNPQNQLFVASATGAVITITAVNGLGALPNTWVVSSTLTTITATYTDMASGVTAVNGLRWATAAAGVISKTADTWSGVGVANGTAGWFRFRLASEPGTAASTVFPRIDGTIATSGADMVIGALTVSISAPFIIPTGTITMPQQ